MADTAPQTRSIRLGIWMMLVIAIILVGGALGITWMLSKKETQSPPQIPGDKILTAPGPDNDIKTLSPGGPPSKSQIPATDTPGRQA